jgi:hypothetical protein
MRAVVSELRVPQRRAMTILLSRRMMTLVLSSQADQLLCPAT